MSSSSTALSQPSHTRAAGCCPAAQAFISTISSCPAFTSEHVAAATNGSCIKDAGATRAAAAICTSACYTAAVASLRTSVVGVHGDGCGVVRSYVMVSDVVCHRNSFNETCLEAAIDLLARGSVAFEDRALRLAYTHGHNDDGQHGNRVRRLSDGNGNGNNGNDGQDGAHGNGNEFSGIGNNEHGVSVTKVCTDEVSEARQQLLWGGAEACEIVRIDEVKPLQS